MHTCIYFSFLLMCGKWSRCDQVWNRTGWLTSWIISILKFLRIPQEQQKHFIRLYITLYFPRNFLSLGFWDKQRSRFLSPFYRWMNWFAEKGTDLPQVSEGQWQSLVWNPHWLSLFKEIQSRKVCSQGPQLARASPRLPPSSVMDSMGTFTFRMPSCFISITWRV